ncbi:hypothetical protein C7212DRAFT_152916, partial [Tuber magnatum]
IRTRIARQWLAKLGFSWVEVRKGMYIDGHECPAVVQDRVEFLERLQELASYIVEFDSAGKIKEKVYREGCEVGGLNPPIILITHDESTLSSNEGRA